MNNKIVVGIKLNIKDLFKSSPNKNGTHYSDEAIENALNNIENAPFISNINDIQKPIGVIKNYSGGFLWVECEPEITINDIEEIDGIKVITSFEINAINIK